MKKIVLASASPRRRELMNQIGLEFQVEVSEEEEHYASADPLEIVKELAEMKAENVLSKIDISDTVVIGADTIVVLNDKIMGKPRNEQHAFEMLKNLQGKMHKVITGVAILNFDKAKTRTTTLHAVETKVYVHDMSDEEVWNYIKTKEPMDKAGAYGIQGRFAAHIERLEGDYFNVVGLPVSYIYQEIKRIKECDQQKSI